MNFTPSDESPRPDDPEEPGRGPGAPGRPGDSANSPAGPGSSADPAPHANAASPEPPGDDGPAHTGPGAEPPTPPDTETSSTETSSAASSDAAPTGPERDAATTEDGIRFALGTLTVLPVGVPRWDRESARRGMEWAPLAGLVVGLTAAAASLLALLLGTGALLAAVVSVAVPAVLTRALHLDGLADVADGLGSNRPADEARRIMKRSDIGPFGVITLVLTLAAQVAVVNELYGEGGWAHGALAVVVAAVTARTAITVAARSGVSAAGTEGLGALVAGTVPVRTAVVAASGTAVVSALAGAVVNWWNPLFGAVSYLFAVVLGLAAAELLARHCRRRFGGVTGDVFGALSECAATAALVVLAFG